MDQPVDNTSPGRENCGGDVAPGVVPNAMTPVRGLEFSQVGAAGVITLPAGAGTVFDPASAVAFVTQLQAWARSPDIYAVIAQVSAAVAPPETLHQTDAAGADDLASIGRQLELIWRTECFPKPIIALLNAPLSGTAIGLTAFATHRVAGEHYGLALPPATRGEGAPLAGIAHRLARMPAALAVELATSGRCMGRDDAYAAGLVTHCIPSDAFPAIVAALADGQPVDPLLDGLHLVPQPSDTARRTRPAVETAAQSATTTAAIQGLLLRVRDRGIRDSLIMTYRFAAALNAGAGAGPAIETAINSFYEMPKSGELSLPQRGTRENGRF